MILAVDVRYEEKCAVVAGVLFSDWRDEAPERELLTTIPIPADYQPGQFYKRELPCILKLIQENDLRPECIIVDGFVYLDGLNEPGLGKHLYDALCGKVAVIGVAKSSFRGIGPDFQILRGGSNKPLYITSVGIELEFAKELIRNMHGEHRIPTLLKRVDHASRMVKTGAMCLSE